MNQVFYIDKGTLVFIDDRIEINDKSWKGSAIVANIIHPVTTLMAGILLISSFKDLQWKMWLGILSILVSIYFFLFATNMNFDKIIPLNHIAKVRIDKDYYHMHSATISLNNRARRRVVLNFDRFSLADFKQMLEAKNIPVESI